MDTTQPMDSKAQCTAKSKQSGVRCKRRPIPGGSVCIMHGGGIPQVREAARLRILELVNPALATMARAVRGKGKPGQVEINAARDILDRAGFAAKQAAGFIASITEGADGARKLEVVFVASPQGDDQALLDMPTSSNAND